MSEDIVDRLRKLHSMGQCITSGNSTLWGEAADNIDRLRAEVASLKEERATSELRLADLSAAHAFLTQQLAAANGRVEKYQSAPKEWVTKDMTFLIMHLKEDTNFDATLVEEMLKFAIECAALSDLPEADKEKTQ